MLNIFVSLCFFLKYVADDRLAWPRPPPPVVRCLLLIFDEFIKIFLLSARKIQKTQTRTNQKKKKHWQQQQHYNKSEAKNSNEFREAKSQSRSRSWSHSLRLVTQLRPSRYSVPVPRCYQRLYAWAMISVLVRVNRSWDWYIAAVVATSLTIPLGWPRAETTQSGIVSPAPAPSRLSLSDRSRTRICISRQLTVFGHNGRTLLGLVVLLPSVSKQSVLSHSTPAVVPFCPVGSVFHARRFV